MNVKKKLSKIRKLLKEGEIKVIRVSPFTVWRIKEEYVYNEIKEKDVKKFFVQRENYSTGGYYNKELDEMIYSYDCGSMNLSKKESDVYYKKWFKKNIDRILELVAMKHGKNLIHRCSGLFDADNDKLISRIYVHSLSFTMMTPITIVMNKDEDMLGFAICAPVDVYNKNDGLVTAFDRLQLGLKLRRIFEKTDTTKKKKGIIDMNKRIGIDIYQL
jgi:hypothetical protein